MAVGTTRGKRRLGRFIKPIRLRSGLSADEVAKRTICSRQTVTRLESGDNLPRIHLFTTLLGVIGATPEERDEALKLWEVADANMSIIERAQDLPAKYLRFRLDESEAVQERTLDSTVIPGMLQTSDYALANSLGVQHEDTSSDWERQADERRERQQLLTRDANPLRLHALIDEAALRRLVGGPTVMTGQLDHLLLMGQKPNITIQVIPFAFGAYGAIGPVVLLSFPEKDEPDSLYLDGVTSMQTVVDSKDVAALSAVWNEVAVAAPSTERSAEIIQEVKDSLS
jgi:transcriptional regulator with XRE-family HTH domain